MGRLAVRNIRRGHSAFVSSIVLVCQHLLDVLEKLALGAVWILYDAHHSHDDEDALVHGIERRSLCQTETAAPAQSRAAQTDRIKQGERTRSGKDTAHGIRDCVSGGGVGARKHALPRQCHHRQFLGLPARA